MMVARALVAQLDRAPGFEPGGRGFESLRARQPSLANFVRELRLGKPRFARPCDLRATVICELQLRSLHWLASVL
jgi:hypothetical protein